jgi:hypothetical protein
MTLKISKPICNLNIEFLVGTNKQSNKDLINESNSDDIWFHLNDAPSCHIVAQVHDLVLSKKLKMLIIRQGAHLVNMQMKTKVKTKVIHMLIRDVREENGPTSGTIP